MNRLYRFLSLLLVSFFFFQCQKELNYIGQPDPVIPGVIVTSDPIQANIQGNILDENNQPAAGVTISAGTKTAITDATGYFRIQDAGLDKKTSTVTAVKAGYFKGYRVLSATAGTNQVVIKLIKKELAGTVASTTGGVATLVNGSKIALPANGVVVASSGAPYTGDVKIYAAYIDPTAADIMSTVPGSFTATDKNGSRVTLASYGMLAVELESAAGEKLQIKQGSTATLTTTIPASRTSSAPATIALWSVDEQTGVWKEEGTATKQGNNYIGEVSHFSFWNCDYPLAAVQISLTLQNSAGSPIVHELVKITRSSTTGWPTSAFGYTDSLGNVGGWVPANENLLLEVLDPCGVAVYSQNIPALAQSANIGVVTVPNNSSSLINFKGKLLDCSGNAVANGYAIISFNNVVRYASTNAAGEFSVSFITCAGSPATAQVIGIDKSTQQQSVVSNVAITSPTTFVPNITACGISAAQFINYTIDGTNYSITSATSDSIVAYYVTQGAANNYVSIMASKNPPLTDNLSFNVQNPTGVGSFPISNLYTQNHRSINVIQPFNVSFTTYPSAVGEFYEGSFSGQFTADSTTTVHNISSTFRVRRTF